MAIWACTNCSPLCPVDLSEEVVEHWQLCAEDESFLSL